ncbi:hypothetical protein C2845_PM16G18950 [Panicum miliaceum]|uniref:Uncharacterized protein n=1 Tax=Panicum miliaceum TaxID=4540 RepID=A0A3L6PS71_PANMI|nr:hypothetical protein C2845_PM16G18950 [Panicum miliaceum]
MRRQALASPRSPMNRLPAGWRPIRRRGRLMGFKPMAERASGSCVGSMLSSCSSPGFTVRVPSATNFQVHEQTAAKAPQSTGKQAMSQVLVRWSSWPACVPTLIAVFQLQRPAVKEAP